jgi:hypothetical protein
MRLFYAELADTKPTMLLAEQEGGGAVYEIYMFKAVMQIHT